MPRFFIWKKYRELYLFSKKYFFVRMILLLSFLYFPLGKTVQLISAVNPFLQGHLSDLGFVAWFPAFYIFLHGGAALCGKRGMPEVVNDLYIFATCGFFLGIVSEFMQFWGFYPGTGDYLDMVAFVASFILCMVLIQGLSVEARRRRDIEIKGADQVAGT